MQKQPNKTDRKLTSIENVQEEQRREREKERERGREREGLRKLKRRKERKIKGKERKGFGQVDTPYLYVVSQMENDEGTPATTH